MRSIRTFIVALSVFSVSVFGFAAPQLASADHCGNYTSPTQTSPPVAVIASGYYGVGGVGALDSYGCVFGAHLAETRLIAPKGEFVVLVLARVTCSTGQQINGSLSGLGVNAGTVPMRCSTDAVGRKSFVSDIYPLDTTKSGTITGSASYNNATYSAFSRTVI